MNFMPESKCNTKNNSIKIPRTLRRYLHENIDGLNIFIGIPNDFKNKKQVTNRCLEIANKAEFPTDYQDMYEHLFVDENAELFMVMDKGNQIYGFATCNNITESSNTYLDGIIIHPDIQGIGFGTKLLREIVKKDGNNFLTARTHNPRVYEMMSNVSYNLDQNLVFPNITSYKVPKEIWDVVYSHPAMKDADKDLVVRNAYPDEKIIQKVKNKSIYNVFNGLNPTDAQVIVVCTKKPDWL